MASRFTPAEQVQTVERFTPPLVQGPIAGEQHFVLEAVPTAEEIEALQRQAYDEAFEEGLAEGRERGYAEARARGEAEIRTAVASLESIVRQLAEPLERVDDAVVDALGDLALTIARHLVRRELKSNPGEVVGVVRETMRHLPIAPRAARIRLHPDDIELVQSAFALRDDSRSWQLEPDPLLTRGGCVVETESSRVDASVESRLAAIASRMLGGEREGDRDR